MGQFPSLHGRKERKGNATSSFVEGDLAPPVLRSRHDHFMTMYSELTKRKGIIPDVFLVYEKPSTQYIDEDGDVAHEFYTEKESVDGQPRRLHRLLNNLRPKNVVSLRIHCTDFQEHIDWMREICENGLPLRFLYWGKERYPIPRLSSDVPIVMWEVEQQACCQR